LQAGKRKSEEKFRMNSNTRKFSGKQKYLIRLAEEERNQTLLKTLERCIRKVMGEKQKKDGL